MIKKHLRGIYKLMRLEVIGTFLIATNGIISAVSVYNKYKPIPE